MPAPLCLLPCHTPRLAPLILMAPPKFPYSSQSYWMWGWCRPSCLLPQPGFLVIEDMTLRYEPGTGARNLGESRKKNLPLSQRAGCPLGVSGNFSLFGLDTIILLGKAADNVLAVSTHCISLTLPSPQATHLQRQSRLVTGLWFVFSEKHNGHEHSYFPAFGP